MGGFVGGKEIDAKAVYSEGEGGGMGRMGPKFGGIFQRGVPMGLEVSYKLFVGDYAGFLESIHPLYDLDVYVAAWVSNSEERVINNQLVGNVLDMDPHVLEFGYRVIEVVVDDVCCDISCPFAGVVDDVVKVYLEV